MKKGLLIISMLAVLLLLATTAFALDDIKVYVNGAKVSFPDQKPMINTDNRTLVPVRFVSEALGAEVEWLQSSRTVKVTYSGKNILLPVGTKQATVDGSTITLDTKADIVNSRTMVPLRFVSEALGASVEWKGTERAIYILTQSTEQKEFEEMIKKDKAMIDSELKYCLSPDIIKESNLNLSLLVLLDKPIEPQLADVRELLEDRFNDKAEEVIALIEDGARNMKFIEKTYFSIDGKKISVASSNGGWDIDLKVWN